MGNVCCPMTANHLPEDTGVRQPLAPSTQNGDTDISQSQISEAEREARRKLQADAAIARSKKFNQGGGGEKLKAKADELARYEKRNREIGGRDLDWN